MQTVGQYSYHEDTAQINLPYNMQNLLKSLRAFALFSADCMPLFDKTLLPLLQDFLTPNVLQGIFHVILIHQFQ